MHRILRQVVEIDVQGGEPAGLQVQGQVSSICHGATGAALEAAFDALDDGERYVLIDRLDVDLGAVPLEGLRMALTTSLAAAVASSLRERGAAPGPRGAAAAGARTRLSRTEALLAAVLHFLRHGRLPWWYADPEARSLDERLLALLADGARDAGAPAGHAAGGAERRAFLDELARVLRSEPWARERLVRQFSVEGVLALLHALDEGLHARVAEALRLVTTRLPGGRQADALQAAIVEVAVDTVSGTPPGTQAASATAADMIRLAVARTGPRASREERRELAARLGIQVPDEPGAQARPSPPRPAEADAEARAVAAEPDGLFVENAGVVLLHPFLPQLFTGLGLAQDGALVQPSRALLLVHHLATGALTAEEHELVLAKVLCGLPIEAPVAREPPVTDAEQAEASALLQAAVRHWDALRSTSADGLRGNFLTRPGRLDLRPGLEQELEWVLRVEPRSFDLLLDRLPWGVAHVKLPWMARILHVEWSP